MPGWRDALQGTPEGVRVAVEVAAGAKADRFPDGFNPWRGRIGVRVRAQAQRGEANAAVVRAVAQAFGVAPAAVTIVAGHLDSRKDLLVAGLGAAAVEAILARHMGDP